MNVILTLYIFKDHWISKYVHISSNLILHHRTYFCQQDIYDISEQQKCTYKELFLKQLCNLVTFFFCNILYEQSIFIYLFYYPQLTTYEL